MRFGGSTVKGDIGETQKWLMYVKARIACYCQVLQRLMT